MDFLCSLIARLSFLFARIALRILVSARAVSLPSQAPNCEFTPSTKCGCCYQSSLFDEGVRVPTGSERLPFLPSNVGKSPCNGFSGIRGMAISVCLQVA